MGFPVLMPSFFLGLSCNNEKSQKLIKSVINIGMPSMQSRAASLVTAECITVSRTAGISGEDVDAPCPIAAVLLAMNFLKV
jgi:hypothetical protein